MEAAGLCYQAGIHAANHALLAVTPLFLKTDPGDIETEHTFPYQVWLWLMCVYEGVFVGPETACTRTVPSVDTLTHTHTPHKQNRPRPPRLLVYDKRPGGIGAAESLFRLEICARRVDLLLVLS